MLGSVIPGLKEPRDLTGQVFVEKTEEKFSGNYSRVYLAIYGDELVSRFKYLTSHACTSLGSHTEGRSEGNPEDREGRIREESTYEADDKAAGLRMLMWVSQKVKRETTVWATAEHPNILPFYGFADDEEFAPFGALISPVSEIPRNVSDNVEQPSAVVCEW